VLLPPPCCPLLDLAWPLQQGTQYSIWIFVD
jgi:hypothetical protein